MKVYIIEELRGNSMSGLDTRWGYPYDQIFVSEELTYNFLMKEYEETKNTIIETKPCLEDGYFSRKDGYLQKISIAIRGYPTETYFIRELEVIESL